MADKKEKEQENKPVKEPKKKKDDKIKDYDSKKYINTNPTLNESVLITVFENTLPSIYEEEKAFFAYSESKILDIKEMKFYVINEGNILADEEIFSLYEGVFGYDLMEDIADDYIHIAETLDNQYKNLYIVTEQDVSELQSILEEYNGIKYFFERIEVIHYNKLNAISLNEEISDLNEFKKLFSIYLDEEILEAVYDIINEQFLSESREPMSVADRRKRARTMRRYSSRMQRGRKRAKRKRADKGRLEKRAKSRTKRHFRKKFSGGKSYKDMSPSQRRAVDKRVSRMSDAQKKQVQRRKLRQARKDDRKSESNKIGGNILTEKRTFRNVPPKKYHELLNKNGSPKTDRRFSMFKKQSSSKLDDDQLKRVMQMEIDTKMQMALEELDKLIQEYGDRKTIAGYAFDIVREFNIGLTAKELAKIYKQYYIEESVLEYGTDELRMNYERRTPGQASVYDDEEYIDDEIK